MRALERPAHGLPLLRQTAHLLLAKAAHDHGSMLAGQRLRRAATRAADRARLRRAAGADLPPAVPADPRPSRQAVATALAASRSATTRHRADCGRRSLPTAGGDDAAGEQRRSGSRRLTNTELQADLPEQAAGAQWPTSR
ncbi:MAG: hypothetical protein WKG07_37055 [Hymenobacter sp.]